MLIISLKDGGWYIIAARKRRITGAHFRDLTIQDSRLPQRQARKTANIFDPIWRSGKA
jgi:hypothetical protein